MHILWLVIAFLFVGLSIADWPHKVYEVSCSHGRVTSKTPLSVYPNDVRTVK